jgi:hypothetical protein
MSASDSPHTVHVVHPPPPRSSGALMIAVMLGLAVVVAVAFLIVMQMNANKPAEQSDALRLHDRLAADEARLAALERPKPDDGTKATLAQSQSELGALTARVAKLEATPDPAAAARLDASDRRLADLDLRLAALERNSQLTDLPQRVAALQTQQAALAARIAHLESLDPSAIMKRAAAEIAFANLVRASATAEPFVAELKTFEALMPGTPETEVLALIAPRGAPTQATLAVRFQNFASRALAAERASGAKTWLGRLWANISNLVVIRRVGDRKGNDNEAILARAGARLEEDNLDAAIREARRAHGAAGTVLKPWLQDALARSVIAAQTAALARRMTAVLAAP